MHIIGPTKDGKQSVTVYDLDNEVYRQGVFDTRHEAQQMAEIWQRYVLFGEPKYTMDEILDQLEKELEEFI
jgi:hypothetical protein